MKVFLFVLLFSLNALSETCSTINYVTRPDSPFEKIPVLDQDGAGICYAYAAAQLANYHVIKSKQADRMAIHPLSIALTSSKETIYSGLGRESLLSSKVVLDYDQIEAALNDFGSQANVSGSTLIGFIDFYGRELKKMAGNRSVTPQMMSEAFLRAKDFITPFCDKEILWDELLPELKTLTGTSVKMFWKILENAKVKLFKIPDIYVTKPFTANGQSIPHLERQILKGPFMVGYCAIKWGDPNFSGLWKSPFSDEKCGLHESIVVGRKKIAGQCHFLIRNSWGNGWARWNRNINCLCRNKNTGAWVDECTEAQHNDGHHTVEACYMDEKRLSNNTYTITSFYP